ncbi:hypothetical protein SprV_0802533000 [Sparganum proliferum]
MIGLGTAKIITENIPVNSAVLYPTMLPPDSIVLSSQPPIKQAGPKARCNQTTFCVEFIQAAMGAYVKGIMNTSVASAVFTGKGNTRGYGIALIRQNSTKKEPSYPNEVYASSKHTIPNGTILVEVYRFNREAGKIEAFDNMIAVKSVDSHPVLGLYSPLLLPQKQQNYSILLINIPKDAKNYTVTYKLPDKTNRTFQFRRLSIPSLFANGNQEIYFEEADITTTAAPTTTSGADRVFPFGIVFLASVILTC